MTKIARLVHSQLEDRRGQPIVAVRSANGAGIASDARPVRGANGDFSRRAFTLLEMMLACVLASLLMVAIFEILRMTLIESRKIAASPQLMSETWLLREQLESDIGNTRAYKITHDTMILGGFLTTHPQTGAKTQQLSLVTYQLVQRGDRKALERTEIPFDTHQSAPRKDTVWYGVGSIVAFPRAEDREALTSSIPELQQQGLQSLSGGMVVRMLDTDGRLLMELH